VLVKIGNIYQCAIGLGVYTPTGYQYTDPYGRVYTMGADGKLQSLKDLNGNTITLTASGITSTAGNLNVPFLRDALGRITKITDPLGKEYNYTYNASGELATFTQPTVPGMTAVPVTYTYSTGHYLTGGTDARNNPLPSTTYYADGRVQSANDGVGNTTQYSYNVATRTTTVTNPDLGVETLVYDAYGMLLTKTDGLNRTTTYTYDTNHNTLTETNPLNQTTTYTYNTTRRKDFRQFLALEFSLSMESLKYIKQPLHRMKLVRSAEKNLPLYYLALFSRHETAYNFWGEVLKYSTDQPSLWD
ncbi:MAG: hypothetical protein ACRD8O_04635, partial [Bryobacteraceae bacterium]